MTQNPFDAPPVNPFAATVSGADAFSPLQSGGGALPPRDIVGHLLIVKPVGIKMIKTENFGEKEAIISSVVDLDATDPMTGQQGSTHREVAWFNGRLIGALKKSVGRPVLIQIGQGEAKGGQNAPFIAIDMFNDAAAKQRAAAWVDANPEFLAQ